MSDDARRRLAALTIFTAATLGALSGYLRDQPEGTLPRALALPVGILAMAILVTGGVFAWRELRRRRAGGRRDDP